MFKPVDPKQDFIAMERKWLEHWYKNGIIDKYLTKNRNSDKYFSFQDGPITANNPMGVHHAWGRTYKDLWQKFFNLLGYRERFHNGFDAQGLWIEVEVEKELGLKSKRDIENIVPGDKKASIAKFVQMCKDRVMHFSKIQTEQSKRLGYFMDWKNSYFTMSDENNYMIWNFLKKCYDNGWIYKGRESVPWCPRCETAISQHEMLTEDYKETTHESIYLKLPIEGKKTEYLLVWTTTPWTIPANIAVAVDEKMEYALVENDKDEQIWVAKDAVKRVFGDKRIVKSVKGKELVGLRYKGAFDDLPEVQKVAKESKNFHTVIPTDEQILSISTEEGTGLVHTAVSAGVEDFKLGKKLNLPMIPVIGDNADYLPGLGFLSGQNAKVNPRLILDYLEQKDGGKYSYRVEDYIHRYPACWRCKAELVWKVTDEWYIAMDKPEKNSKKTLRQRMMDVAKKITWMPSFGLERELDWLKNMHDWLISKKNRYWGLSLPIYECEKCKEFEVIGSKDELKKRAIEDWKKFEGHSPHKPYIDEVVIKCEKCGGNSNRVDDVGNPWLDAGIVTYSTIKENNQGEPLYWKDKKEWQKWFPADFITESFPGQFKNWFYSLIAMSSVLENENPFKTVLGFGTLLGEDGRPMHKSWGNAIEFNEGADKIGVDVMRWMYSRQNPADNMLFGYKKADEVRRLFYLILWNVYKFFIDYATLEKFDPTTFKTNAGRSKNDLDRWILSRFTVLIINVEKKLKKYDAKSAALDIEKFVNDLSTWYLRRSRERVWVNSTDENDKRHFYSTLHYILENLVIVISPFTPFLSEEIYTNLTKKASVHLAKWPAAKADLRDLELEKQVEQARVLVEQAHARRKELKIKVRHPLNSLTVTSLTEFSEGVSNMIRNEVNVRTIISKKGKETKIVDFDTSSNSQLEKEGALREIIRKIQNERKRLGTRLDDKVDVILEDWPQEFEEDIKRRALVRNLKKGAEFEVEKV